MRAATITLEAAGSLSRTPHDRQAFRYTGTASSPAAVVSLRAIDPERYSILHDGVVVETIEESKAFFQIYDGACCLATY